MSTLHILINVLDSDLRTKIFDNYLRDVTSYDMSDYFLDTMTITPVFSSNGFTATLQAEYVKAIPRKIEFTFPIRDEELIPPTANILINLDDDIAVEIVKKNQELIKNHIEDMQKTINSMNRNIDTLSSVLTKNLTSTVDFLSKTIDMAQERINKSSTLEIVQNFNDLLKLLPTLGNVETIKATQNYKLLRLLETLNYHKKFFIAVLDNPNHIETIHVEQSFLSNAPCKILISPASKENGGAYYISFLELAKDYRLLNEKDVKIEKTRTGKRYYVYNFKKFASWCEEQLNVNPN